MLGLAGVPIPGTMQGRNLQQLLRGDRDSWRRDFYYEHMYVRAPNHPRGQIPRIEGIRNERWKYVRYIDQEPPYEQLFDLLNDPSEETNLATSASHGDILTALRKRWGELRVEVR